MRRITTYLITLSTIAAVPTAAFAASAAQDPDGRSLTASWELWLDPLIGLLFTCLGI